MHANFRYRPPQSDAKLKQNESQLDNESIGVINDITTLDCDISMFKRIFEPPSPVPTLHTSYLVNILCAMQGTTFFTRSILSRDFEKLWKWTLILLLSSRRILNCVIYDIT